jgi:hypothetical protein
MRGEKGVVGTFDQGAPKRFCVYDYRILRFGLHRPLRFSLTFFEPAGPFLWGQEPIDRERDSDG